MKITKFLAFALITVLTCVGFASCSDDDDEPTNKEYHSSLFGEWVETGGGKYIKDYYYFSHDGTGIHGSYETDIDWVNEDEDFTWYTVNDEYLYIDGHKYAYECDGSSLYLNGKTYIEK